MKLSECIADAAVMLQLAAGSPDAALEALENETRELLAACGNFVLNEIAAEYLPLKKTETAVAESGMIPYEKLSEKIVDFYGARRNGRDARVRRFPRHAEVREDGAYAVTYSYAPQEASITDEVSFWGERVGARTLAYGIACEYCIATGRTEDAVLWDRRYKDSLSAAARDVGEKKWRSRKWYL